MADGEESQPTDVLDLTQGRVPQDQFGWPELQVGAIKEAVAIAEALPGRLHHYLISL
jgi:hypothetical protein